MFAFLQPQRGMHPVAATFSSNSGPPGPRGVAATLSRPVLPLAITCHRAHLFVPMTLTSRSTTLTFDGKDTKRLHMPAGVPQGSPLSPILFILFITLLFRLLKKQEGIIGIRYADDINLLAPSRIAKKSCEALKGA